MALRVDGLSYRLIARNLGMSPASGMTMCEATEW